ncbi:Hypothetical predicted protein, partial [Paramuricea clavata]
MEAKETEVNIKVDIKIFIYFPKPALLLKIIGGNQHKTTKIQSEKGVKNKTVRY